MDIPLPPPRAIMPKDHVSIRIPRSDIAKLRELAAAHSTNVNALIELAVSRYLADLSQAMTR